MVAVLEAPGIALRPMTLADVAAVMPIELAVYPFPWTETIFSDCLRAGYNGWVVVRQDRVIGYGVMSVAVGESHILNVCIEPQQQGQGLGRHLLRHLLQVAAQRGADTAFLEVRPTNTVALGLYESIGFNEIGRRVGYYPAVRGREDALVLACALPL